MARNEPNNEYNQRIPTFTGVPNTDKGQLMKRLTRTALALSGGAAGLVVLAVVAVVVLLYAAISPPPTSARVTPTPPAPTAVLSE